MHPVQLFELVFIMLLAILVLHWIARSLKLPPAVALLVATTREGPDNCRRRPVGRRAQLWQA